MAPKEDAAVTVSGLKRKVEGGEEESPVKEKKVDVAEVGVFEEPDAPADKRPAIKGAVDFDSRDATLNVIPAMGGKMLMALSEGGMQNLLAGARANVGVKKGRYMFEVKIVEVNAAGASPAKAPSATKHIARIGFSTWPSSLLMGSITATATDKIEDACCFDADGFWYCPEQKKKEMSGKKFGKDEVMGVVLNLDPESPNANTVQLFKDGIQASKPLKLPASLQGVPLYPHVTYRNVTLQVNFGSEPMQPLPYKCRLWQTAACDDAKIEPSSKPTDGKFDVVFPIGVPDEGTFSWLDDFMQENPHFVELSDRKIVEWAQKSGLFKPKSGTPGSNDEPSFNFGVPSMDDLSVRKVIQSIVRFVPRHYLVMEVRGNLMPAIR